MGPLNGGAFRVDWAPSPGMGFWERALSNASTRKGVRTTDIVQPSPGGPRPQNTHREVR